VTDPADRVLLRAMRRGDQAAARALHVRLSPGLHVYARGLLHDAALADDAVQSAFCRVMELPTRRVDAVESVGAWMAMLVRHEALSVMRAHRRRVARERRRSIEAGARAGSMRTSDTPDDAALRRAIGALPHRMAEVVLLRHVAGLTFDQIATGLSINRNTAASRYRLAMERLRRVLTPGASDKASGGDAPQERGRVR
jgi:RNA polymerase sigma-70 factor, ECF subfamily